MSRDFSPEKSCLSPTDPGDKRFFSENLINDYAGTGLTRIDSREPDTNQSGTLPDRSYQFSEEISEMLHQLHSFQPLRRSGNQRELARKALIALKNRQPEDMRNLANRLAEDVAGAVD